MVHSTRATPSEPVVRTLWDNMPLPEITSKLTSTPGTGTPSLLMALTWRPSETGRPTMPAKEMELRASMDRGMGQTVAWAEASREE